MAMGNRKKKSQPSMWVATQNLAKTAGHPFYCKLNEAFQKHDFDSIAESKCAKFYAEKVGRRGIPPGVYFRMLMIGYFEGIDSERGIAWRCEDSLSLRSFLGYGLDEDTPDHSSLSRIRNRIDLETHQEIFTWVLTVLAKEKVLEAKALGIDATTLEANAAMRSIVRKDTGESYQEFLKGLAKESGIDTPTREDLAKLDRKRKKKTSNDDWHNPHDPDSKITKMKDGRTHLSNKSEHAVDLDSGAVMAVTVQGADTGDTTTIDETLADALLNLEEMMEDPKVRSNLPEEPIQAVVTDKGYHSASVVTELAEMGIRTYIPEQKRHRRRWKGRPYQREAVYANRRRVRGNNGKRLLRKRAELVERSFEHIYDRGGMRRTHLRGHQNILKRLLIHVCGFNLGILMRKVLGHGTPKALRAGVAAVCEFILSIWHAISKRRGQYSISEARKHVFVNHHTFVG
jgi:transposase